MTGSAVRKHVHDDTQGVAQEEPERVTQSLDIETNLFCQSSNLFVDKRRNCDRGGMRVNYHMMDLRKLQPHQCGRTLTD